ncbi:MAG TPA: hypothetical protein VL326_12900 [Kofleriaceae bacterium]|jgi:hypothetical protein|nr:hypothetical protein [Kofleriaceae bacterium]
MRAALLLLLLLTVSPRQASATPFDDLKKSYEKRGDSMYVTSIWIDDIYYCLEDYPKLIQDWAGTQRLQKLLKQYRKDSARVTIGLLVIDLTALSIRYKTSNDADAALIDVTPAVSADDVKNIALFIDSHIRQDTAAQVALQDKKAMNTVAGAVHVAKTYIDDPLVSRSRKAEILAGLKTAAVNDPVGLASLKKSDPDAFRDLAGLKTYKFNNKSLEDWQHTEAAQRFIHVWSNKDFVAPAPPPPNG